MDEKVFFLGIVQRSVRVLVKASEKIESPRQPGKQEIITAFGAVFVFMSVMVRLHSPESIAQCSPTLQPMKAAHG